MSGSTILLAGFVLGVGFCTAILWSRVDACRADSPTGQCAIWMDSGGVKLAQVQWPHLSNKGNKE